jgi:hypothetical protein
MEEKYPDIEVLYHSTKQLKLNNATWLTLYALRFALYALRLTPYAD